MTPRHHPDIQEAAGELRVSERELRAAQSDAFQCSSYITAVVHDENIAARTRKIT
jgi:hypothetical protein